MKPHVNSDVGCWSCWIILRLYTVRIIYSTGTSRFQWVPDRGDRDWNRTSCSFTTLVRRKDDDIPTKDPQKDRHYISIIFDMSSFSVLSYQQQPRYRHGDCHRDNNNKSGGRWLDGPSLVGILSPRPSGFHNCHFIKHFKHQEYTQFEWFCAILGLFEWDEPRLWMLRLSSSDRWS